MEQERMSGWDGRGLVSTSWLEERLADADLRIVDVTTDLRPLPAGGYEIVSGRSDYEAAHIPGAAFVDLVDDVSDLSSGMNFTMCDADRFGRALGAAGLCMGMRVVVYSSGAAMWATRLWWMLRACGFDDAAVLDGGFAKWRREGRPIESGSRSFTDGGISLSTRPEMWADKAEVLRGVRNRAVCTINTLPTSVHTGEDPGRYPRAGHVAGSRNVPYETLLAPDGTLWDDMTLRGRFEAIDAFGSARAICYCGGGIAATTAALALVRLGHPSVAVYDGSLAEWSRDPTLPMELGSGI